MNLADTQALFWRLVVAPQGAAQGLEALEPAARLAAATLVHGDHRLSPIARLDVYGEMYFFRLLDVLRADFPVLTAVVGEVDFHNLITDYLLAHPPTHFSLRYAGEHLPSFLAHHPLRSRYAFAADLARLEWSMHDAFDASDASPITPACLTALPPEAWPGLRFTLTPSLQLLDLEWPVQEIVRAVKHQSPIPALASSAVSIRVWREGWRVWHRAIAADENRALASIAAGACFAEVCEALSSESSTAAERASGLLRVWLADGLLTAIL